MKQTEYKNPDGRVINAWIGSGAMIESGAWIGSRAVIESGAWIEDGAVIESRAVIESGAWIGGGAWIGSGAWILKGTKIPSKLNGATFQCGQFLITVNEDKLAIGCEIKPIKDWMEMTKRQAIKLGLREHLYPQYKYIVEMIAKYQLGDKDV